MDHARHLPTQANVGRSIGTLTQLGVYLICRIVQI
jgi:hypothetical protein